MNIFASILTLLQRDLYIFDWRDLLEIFFFSSIVYAIQIWLRSDTQKNLLLYFFGYATLNLIAYYTHCPTVSAFLLITAPIVFICFIMLHQVTLQKNFITLKRLHTPHITFDWFMEFTKSILTMLNTQKEIIYVIERSDSLSNIIFSGCTYYADIQKDSMELFLEKHIGGSSAFIWINQEGKLIAINGTWQINDNALWTSPEARVLHKWKQDALYITGKTDAIVLKAKPNDRTFDMVIQGTLLEELVPESAINLLKKYLLTPKNTPEAKLGLIPHTRPNEKSV